MKLEKFYYQPIVIKGRISESNGTPRKGSKEPPCVIPQLHKLKNVSNYSCYNKIRL